MSIKKLLKQSQELLGKMNSGKEFTSQHVYTKLSIAADKHPNDVLLNTMRDVMAKTAAKKPFVSQKEIADIYNKLYKYSGSFSNFRSELPEFLPEGYGQGKAPTRGASSSRVDMGQSLEPLQDYRADLKPLAQALSTAFSLDKKGSFGGYNRNDLEKAERFASIQLKSIGAEPRAVKAVNSNEHFILCLASYVAADNSEIILKVPVQHNGTTPTVPTHFIQNGDIEALSQKNVLSFLKESEYANRFKKTAKFEELRRNDSVSVERTELANSISKWANLEQDLVEASATYDKNTVRLASSVLTTELKSFGVFNPQVKLNASYDRGLIFDVSFGGPTGHAQMQLPVEISGKQPLPPVSFKVANQTYDFSRKGFDKFALENSVNKSSKISLKSDYLEHKTYNELVNIMITAANKSDLKTSEDCLMQIQRSFDGQLVVNALSKYSQILKNASLNSQKEKLIKIAIQKGDLIKTKNSFDLYSPKYGKPLSKLAFDAKGNLVPKYREQNKNLEESETIGISTSQIKLT